MSITWDRARLWLALWLAGDLVADWLLDQHRTGYARGYRRGQDDAGREVLRELGLEDARVEAVAHGSSDHADRRDLVPAVDGADAVAR